MLDDGEEDEMVKVDEVAGSGTHDDGSGSEVSDGGLEAELEQLTGNIDGLCLG